MGDAVSDEDLLRGLLFKLLDDWHGGYVVCGENVLVVDKHIEVTDAEQSFCLAVLTRLREENLK